MQLTDKSSPKRTCNLTKHTCTIIFFRYFVFNWVRLAVARNYFPLRCCFIVPFIRWNMFSTRGDNVLRTNGKTYHNTISLFPMSHSFGLLALFKLVALIGNCKCCFQEITSFKISWNQTSSTDIHFIIA